MNRKTAAYYYHRRRGIIYQAIADTTPVAGEMEVDESCCGGRRQGRCRRHQRCQGHDTLPILKQRIVPDSVVYSDSLPSYNALAVAGFRHLRINHSKLFAAGKNHINGIENFWNQAKRHLRKFNGIPQRHFPSILEGMSVAF